MNTGLQDAAANLGWKLVAAIQGWARPGLLDTYHHERHRVGRLVLRVSGGMLRVVLMRPTPSSVVTALAAIAVRVRPIARRAAATVSGIGIRYPRDRGGHHVVGRRAPDVTLAGGGRLYEVLRDSRFVLLGADHVGSADHLRVARPAHTTGVAMLVRPDGYVAWAARGPDPAAIRRAVASWCPAVR